MSASKIFLYFCLSFIGGIFLSSFFIKSQVFILQIFCLVNLILGILLISVFWRRWNLVIIGFCFLFLVLGVWRYHLTQPKIIYFQEENVVFYGTIILEPDVRASNVKLTIKPEENDSFLIFGKVLVTTGIYPEYQYGDKLKIAGKLEKPKELDDFNYPEYLSKDGIYSVIYYPKIDLLERENYDNFFSIVYAKVLRLKNELRHVVNRNFSPPQSFILGALILGDKRQISGEWREKLNYAGLRHITAISGMHIAILTALLTSFFIGLGFWRQQAFYLTLIFIIFFIIAIGFQSSAVRAGIMGGLFLIARYLGRKNISIRSAVFASTLMLIHNPLILRQDIGFQLSFLAILGIIYFLPVFRKYFKKDILAITLSAQVFTLPILIYNFGYFSLATPLTNILIVPILPFLMFLGFIFILSGLVFQPLAWLFSLPLYLALSYLIKIIDWFSGFYWSVYFFEISLIWLVMIYLILILIAWRLQKISQLEFLN